jgi:hypothetical protein
MEPTSSPQSGRSAREAARRGADAIRHSRFLGAQEPRPLSGAPQARSQPQASDPCSQSQIGHERYLLWQRTAQVEAPSVLSVVVRWRPVKTDVNGTIVARPVRRPGTDWRRWLPR